MNPQRVVHIIDAQAHDKGQPQRQPDQYNIGGDLNQPFATPGQSQQIRSNLIHHPVHYLSTFLSTELLRRIL
ncbi:MULTISPECIES: hypothetical protein [unclassified Pseudomonas]|uniref:hypothetical protein n=1 Tax=unclassified Pseudomonas TaxID=196821 RepID=UPI00215CC0A7|nr:MULTISPECIES: hypothetical protein [unclassified Pseudomonas]MCR8935510.1 hypothetical protein [Pseudomonas sp. S11A4]MCR8973781.1 hypothetical protein [Pseudomonas sp. S11P7]